MASDEQLGPHRVYWSPRSYTGAAIAHRAESLVVVAVLVFLLIRGGNSAGLVTLMFLGIMVSLSFGFWRIKSEIGRRIALMDDCFWIGGLDKGETIPYDEVTLLQFHRIGTSTEVVAQTCDRGVAIHLDRRDANECFEALRGLCGSAAAIDADSHAHISRDPALQVESRLVLLGIFKRKARNVRLAIAFALVIWLGMISLFIAAWPFWSQSFASWAAAIGLPLVIVLCARMHARFRCELHALEQESATQR